LATIAKDVLGGQRRAVVKLDSFAQGRRKRQAVSRERPFLGDVADDLRIVVWVEAQQHAVMRRDRMEHSKSRLAMAVEGRRGLGDGEDEFAAGSGRLRGRNRAGK
jgi:hypothetical protein